MGIWFRMVGGSMSVCVCVCMHACGAMEKGTYISHSMLSCYRLNFKSNIATLESKVSICHKHAVSKYRISLAQIFWQFCC